MTITLETAPVILTPSNDPTPVEKAVIDGILDDFPPETFLTFVFHRADGGARLWHAWTDGGTALGDRVDQLATAAGMDAADDMAIGARHVEQSTRGRVEINAYPLRPILADVEGEHGSDPVHRDKLRRALDWYAEQKGWPVLDDGYHAPWIGYGPKLRNR